MTDVFDWMDLKCELKPKDKEIYKEQLLEALDKLDALKAEKTALMSSMKDKMDAQEERIQKLRNALGLGYEFRKVKCSVRYDWEAGTVTFVRIDTGEAVETREITEEERQGELIKGEATTPLSG